MSLSSYRSQVIQATKKDADLQKKVGDQRAKIAKLKGEIGAIQRSITKYTTASSVQSKQRQIESKEKELAKVEEQLGALLKQQASNFDDLTRYTQNKERAEAQDQKKLDAEAKKRRDEELRHAQDVTREIEKQRRLHGDLSRSHLVIDLAKLPTKITVLFLAANPRDLRQLGLDEEIRLIGEKLRAADYRDSVELVSRWAVRSSDLLQALNETKPHIVHFSGHGNEDGIALQNPDGSTKLLGKELFTATLRTVSDHIRVVVFNSCFSKGQAETVTEHVDIAIGMNASVGDEVARIFAGQFYSSLGFGLSVQTAFDQALVQLRLEAVPGAHIPELHSRPGIDPNEVIIVRPPGF